MRAKPLEGNQRFACECRRADGERKRLQTPRRLEPVYGVAPRFIRIDTLKCGDTAKQSVFGRGGARLNKHMRGGRKPKRMNWQTSEGEKVMRASARAHT